MESPFVRLYEHRLLDSFAPSALSRFNRLVLHREIAVASRQAVFVGAALSNGRRNEISVRGRRRRSPFQGGRFPWVVVHLFAALNAPESIAEEGDLRQTHGPGRP